MRTRAEALAFLHSRGFVHATQRDWSLGETVVIPGGTMSTRDGITAFSRVIYLAPVGERWRLHDAEAAETVGPIDLEEACELATQRLGLPPSMAT